MAKSFKKLKDIDTFYMRYNPLYNLSIKESQQIFDASRNGNYRRIQYIYEEMEKACPALLLCVERRLAAISSRKWMINTVDDSTESQKQKKLFETYLNSIDNLNQALEHLATSFFRGFAFIEPIEHHWNILEQKNFVKDLDTDVWYWCVNDNEKIEIPLDEMISIQRDRPVDYPIMAIFLRSSVGEREYGRFLEHYGLPPVSITMPETMSQEDVPAFKQAAQDIADGKSGVLPFGSEVNFADEARGVNPFIEFLKHQEEEIIRLCTGSTITSIAEAGTGTLAGNAAERVWKQITERDAEMIGEAITKWLYKHLLDNTNQKQLAYFQFQDEISQEEKQNLLDNIIKLKSAGFNIDSKWISETFDIPIIDETNNNEWNVPAIKNEGDENE